MRSGRFLALGLFATGVFGTTTARAEDLLDTIDTLTAEGRCVSALILLERAEGTPASIAGRRGLCEARLGRTAEAAVHVAEALRAPEDAWVASHREALAAALRPAVIPPAPTTTTRIQVAANPYYYSSAEAAEVRVVHATPPAVRVPAAYIADARSNPYYVGE